MRSVIRSGLTLIEMVVVIGITGLLLALTFSAVNAARESARRAQCAANLGQFGRALHAYEAANRAFPAALPAIDNDPKKGSNLWYAPHISLLPFIEQSALAGGVNLQQPMGIPLGLK
jgi:prepilin-type N-terminal cleavage/methylation domain-containing protein